MKHGRTVQASKNLTGLILAEGVGYERRVFFGSVRNTGEFLNITFPVIPYTALNDKINQHTYSKCYCLHNSRAERLQCR